ncbi:hypothetical protein TeGR_g15270 [Tetraparma gracilis]|uniref:Palmitoyltransferase n=1 Tax=Tetraparma gracilis TaxID=2962635 RepID=A0ABQ6MMH1_9STRA|nr:hypothetical protein TeGR_g15270 [Tetraparma gracilis]
MSYTISPLYFTLSKTIIDFTGCLVFRLPLLCGGAYYTYCLVSSQLFIFVAVLLYNTNAAEGLGKIDAGTLWAGASSLAAGWLITFAYFAFRIAVPKYRHTIWSGTSGRKCVQDYFVDGKDDENRFGIFGCNLLLWESDIGEEVRAWTAQNWARWKEEKPAWFKVEKVPDRFIPAAELQQLGHNRKRRGSAAGSIRESFREGVD